MEWLARIPEWVVWLAAAGMGLLMLLIVVSTLEAVFDLERH